MKQSSVTKIRFQGNFREKRRATPRRVLGFVAGLGLLGGLIYVLLFSHVLAITKVELSGFERTDRGQVEAMVWAMINERDWYLQFSRDILFFDEDAAQTNLAELFPSLQEISVTKKYWHTLHISGKERAPIGIWCARGPASPLGGLCSYFDTAGAVWGNALRSSGALLMVIDDQRLQGNFDQEFVMGVQKITALLPELNLAVKDIVVPETSPAEFTVQTASYALKFALDHPLEDQLQTLRIFLENKKSDQNFHPSHYVDLRIPGRVYVK